MSSHTILRDFIKHVVSEGRKNSTSLNNKVNTLLLYLAANPGATAKQIKSDLGNEPYKSYIDAYFGYVVGNNNTHLLPTRYIPDDLENPNVSGHHEDNEDYDYDEPKSTGNALRPEYIRRIREGSGRNKVWHHYLTPLGIERVKTIEAEDSPDWRPNETVPEDFYSY